VENTVGAKPSPMGNPEDAMADESTVKSIIEHYKSNPIILKIKENSLNETFTFPKISRKEINIIIKELNTGKATGIDNIPAYFVKIAADILDEPLTKIFNKSISENRFCEGAKTAVIPPISRKTTGLKKKTIDL